MESNCTYFITNFILTPFFPLGPMLKCFQHFIPIKPLARIDASRELRLTVNITTVLRATVVPKAVLATGDNAGAVAHPADVEEVGSII